MCCAEPEVQDTEDDQNELTGSYTFEQLSDKAKAAARDANRDWNVDGIDWWDYTYEDAVRMGALLGIEIGQAVHTQPDPDIQFCGFWSQGDHASFAGEYRPKADAVSLVKAECNDEELIRIAEALTVLQLTAKLLYGDVLWATIKHSQRIGIDVEVTAIDEGHDTVNTRFEDANDTDVTDDEEKQVRSLMNDFASWIYCSLEAEYDYLTSDEALDDALADRLFDGDGTLII